MPQPPLFIFVGHSGAGKTSFVERLVGELDRRGLRVATIKHTHHKFDIDAPGSDTQRHRAAGAAETAIVSGSRVAIIEEIACNADRSSSERQPGP